MKAIKACRSCGSKDLVEFLNLGSQYISDFREDTKRPPKYPLEVVFCENCKLVQLRHTTPQAEMYHSNYGFKSGISESIKSDLMENVMEVLKWIPQPDNWLDIASNDGTLLSFVPRGITTVGVDPVGFLCDEARSKADLIINDYFTADSVAGMKFDAITSISCFYDMPDPGQFVKDVEAVLAEDGVWDIQQNYLLTTMQLNAVDNICHEHLEYYTLMSLEHLLSRYGLEVFDLQLPTVNGGSIRTMVCHKGAYPIQDSVEKQRTIEAEHRLDKIDPYIMYAGRVSEELEKLNTLLMNIKFKRQTCYILAASTRGATIWQSAGITAKLAPYAIERNPAKVGKYFSAIGIPIISEQQAADNPPNYKLVGPWFFAEEILNRELDYILRGGRLIVPLPKLRIISLKDLENGQETGDLVPNL